MKRLLWLVLLAAPCYAQTGFSPTMPFGLPASREQAPVNSGIHISGSHCPNHNSYWQRSSYYYGGWNGGWGTVYSNSLNYNALPSGNLPPAQVGGELPGYNQKTAKKTQSPPGY